MLGRNFNDLLQKNIKAEFDKNKEINEERNIDSVDMIRTYKLATMFKNLLFQNNMFSELSVELLKVANDNVATMLYCANSDNVKLRNAKKNIKDIKFLDDGLYPSLDRTTYKKYRSNNKDLYEIKSQVYEISINYKIVESIDEERVFKKSTETIEYIKSALYNLEYKENENSFYKEFKPKTVMGNKSPIIAGNIIQNVQLEIFDDYTVRIYVTEDSVVYVGSALISAMTGIYTDGSNLKDEEESKKYILQQYYFNLNILKWLCNDNYSEPIDYNNLEKGNAKKVQNFLTNLKVKEDDFFYISPKLISSNDYVKPDYSLGIDNSGELVYIDTEDTTEEFEDEIVELYKKNVTAINIIKSLYKNYTELCLASDLDPEEYNSNEFNFVYEEVLKEGMYKGITNAYLLYKELYSILNGDLDSLFNLPVSNRILKIDYNSDDILYVSNGKVYTKSILGIKELKYQSLHKFLSLPIRNIFYYFEDKDLKLDLPVSNEFIVECNKKIEVYAEQEDTLYQYGTFGNTPLLEIILRKNTEEFKTIYELFRKEIKNSLNYIEMNEKKIGVYYYNNVKGFYEFFADYNYGNYKVASEVKKIELQLAETNSTYFEKDEDIKLDSIPCANNLSLLPHQAEAVYKLQKNTDLGSYILPVEPGGGKTIISILSLVNLIQKGKIKKPLIVVPQGLLGNWYSEIKRFTDTKFNVILVNTDTMKEHGVEKMTELILNAPVNTFVVTSMSFISKWRGGDDFVPTTITTKGFNELNPGVEFLLRFKFDSLVVDESQYIKNENANITKAIHRLNRYIKQSFIMSGTMVHDTPIDLASQLNLVDSSIFGKTNDFMKKYYPNGKKIQPSMQVLNNIKQKIKENVIECRATQERWAYMLPEFKEKFHFVRLSNNQLSLYRAIVNDLVTELKELAVKNKDVELSLNSLTENTEEEDLLELSPTLVARLQRLETFVCNPAGDPTANFTLPEDKESPKIKKVDEVIDRHIEEEGLGKGHKILIFCSHKHSAKSVYELSKHKERMVYYEAGMEDNITIFNNSNKIGILVAVEHSVREGRNLQIASRLIRMESRWSPGDIAQANARIFRPDVKGLYDRDYISIDWILADNTIDVPKTMKLIEKTITKTIIDNVRNSDRISTIDSKKVRINLDTLNAESKIMDYSAHLEAYDDLQKILSDNRRFYRLNSTTKVTPVEEDTPSFEIGKVEFEPYVNTIDTLAESQEFGLTKITKDNVSILEVGLPVRTQYGWGTIERIYNSKDRVNVSFITEGKNGKEVKETISQYTNVIFAPTKQSKIPEAKKLANTKITKLDVKKAKEAIINEKILEPKVDIKAIDNKNVPLSENINILKMIENKNENINNPVPKTDNKKEDGGINVYLTNINGAFAITIPEDDEDSTKIVKKLDFSYQSKYLYYKVPSIKKGRELLEIFRNSRKYKFDETQLEVIEEFVNKTKNGIFKGKVNPSDVRTFLQQKHKISKKEIIKLYPLIQGDSLFICADIDTQKYAKEYLTKLKTEYKFKIDDPFYYYVGKNKTDIVETLIDIINKGIKITNIVDVIEDLKDNKMSSKKLVDAINLYNDNKNKEKERQNLKNSMMNKINKLKRK